MKNLIASLSVFLAVSALAADAHNAGTVRGAAFLHTLRNSPKIERAGAPLKCSQGETLKADGLSAECGKKQYAALRLSNGAAIIAHPETKFAVESLEQDAPQTAAATADEFGSYPRARSNSKLAISFSGGRLDFDCPEPTAKSVLVVKTRSGNFEFRAKSFYIAEGKNGIEVVVLDGFAEFKADSGRTDFIRNRQCATVKNGAEKSDFPLEIEQIGMLREREISRELAPCRQLRRSVVFGFDTKNGFAAKRITPADFLLSAPKN